MKAKKDIEIYYTLTQIKKTYRLPLNKIKETLVREGVCDLQGLRVIPKQSIIDKKEALEFESSFGDRSTYYKFQKALIKNIFSIKLPPELNPMTWREAKKMDVKKIENFLRKKDDTIKKDSSILSKWENEINYFLEKNIKQKIIIEFIFENDEEIKNKYINNYSSIQSMMSKFCAKLKKSKK